MDNCTTFQRDGFVVLRDLLPAALVRAFAASASHYLTQRGPRVLDMRRVFPSSFWGGGTYVGDVRTDVWLRPLFQLVHGSARLQSALAAVLGGPARFLHRNELVADRLLSWHRDRLDGELLAFTGGLDPWDDANGTASARYAIVAVGLFLQDHANDSLGLVVQPGTHANAIGQPPHCVARASQLVGRLNAMPNTSTAGTRREAASASARCAREAAVTVRTRLGDAVIFDTRAVHRSGTSAAARALKARAHRAMPAPRTAAPSAGPARGGDGDGYRMLMTLSYGASGPCVHCDAHARALRLRNRLLTDASLCNLTLGTGSRDSAGRRCVRRLVAAELDGENGVGGRGRRPQGGFM